MLIGGISMNIRWLSLVVIFAFCTIHHARPFTLTNTFNRSVYIALYEGNIGEGSFEEIVHEIKNKTFRFKSLMAYLPSERLDVQQTTSIDIRSDKLYLIQISISPMSKLYPKYTVIDEQLPDAHTFMLIPVRIASRFAIQLTVVDHANPKKHGDLTLSQPKPASIHFTIVQPSEAQENDAAGSETDIKALKTKFAALKNLSPEATTAVEKEFKQLDRINPASPEYSFKLTYLEWVANLPWDTTTQEQASLQHAKSILNKEHYGLEKVKEEIIDFIASRLFKEKGRQSNQAGHTPILCLVGPPGVGKTTIAQSIAKALNRTFCKVSVGGINDPSELIGHRRSYVGAFPGRIITTLCKAGSSNPLFLLDEVDKIAANNTYGNASATLLEALDPEQNHGFVDHYLGFPFDLSKVLFIATANNLRDIPAPLRDRMKIIQIPAYTLEEKIGIAQKCIIPKVIKAAGLDPLTINFSDAVIKEVINGYAREAGVRGLQQQLATLAVKSARAQLEGSKGVTFTPQNLTTYLGQRKYRSNTQYSTDVYAEDRLQIFKDSIEQLPLSEQAYAEAKQQFRQTENCRPEASEYQHALSYLEQLTSLPWGKETIDSHDLVRARATLDREHNGLEKVKETVLDYLATLALDALEKKQVKQQQSPRILCLVGPPGVGKTTIAQSIAHALNRKFQKIAMGGLHSATDLTGNQKTYVDAAPGLVMQAIRKAGSCNPVILLDEIDKVTTSSTQHGNPNSVLLELLDPAQNHAWTDLYLNFPFDLSQVLFITTANELSDIPGPLRDRMEIAYLPGYSVNEKIVIAVQSLIPKAVKALGSVGSQFSLGSDVVREIITGYTREAGVRELERIINKLSAKYARTYLEKNERMKFSVATLARHLGARKIPHPDKSTANRIGIANGLAWSASGGDLLHVEVLLMPGKGKLQLTGQLGDVLKESAHAALSYARANAAQLGIDPKKFTDFDIHIHMPEGATPKDGPSAGITLLSSLVSALSGRAVKGNVAMTGEINLQGKMLAIGGLKEKIIAAREHGVTSVVAPLSNKADAADFDASVLDGMNLIWSSNATDALKQILVAA